MRSDASIDEDAIREARAFAAELRLYRHESFATDPTEVDLAAGRWRSDTSGAGAIDFNPQEAGASEAVLGERHAVTAVRGVDVYRRGADRQRAGEKAEQAKPDRRLPACHERFWHSAAP